MDMTGPTTLYRFYDGSGSLLYVGIAGNPGRRFEQHAKTKHWWADVASVAITHYQTRDEALVAETAAIQTEAPAYNIVKGDPSACHIRSAVHTDPAVMEALHAVQRAYDHARDVCRERKASTRLVEDACRMVDEYDRCDNCERIVGYWDLKKVRRYPWAVLTKGDGQRKRVFECNECGHTWSVWSAESAMSW